MALLNVAISNCPQGFSSFTHLNKGNNVVPPRKGSHKIKCGEGNTLKRSEGFSSYTLLNKENNLVEGKFRVPSLNKGSHKIKCVKGDTVTPTVVNLHTIKRSDFPTDFIFGTGTSAYETEGAFLEDGKRLSVWDVFAHEYPDKINGGANGDVATDSYHRYKEDIELLKNMGVDSYRFSIAWTRILPKGTLSGGINQAGIDHYNNVINELLKNGIEPFVTLFHFDSPQALQEDYGGFLSRTMVDHFKDYCDICFQNFGDRVQYWTTINEPVVIAQYGYDMGTAPPGRCTPSLGCSAGDSATEPYIVTHNLILAHAAAAKLYNEKYKLIQRGEIGMSLVGPWFMPYSNLPEDQEAADRALDFFMGWYLGPLVYGEYPSSMRALVKDRLPTFTEEEKKWVKGSADFIGINYYTSRYAKGIPPSKDLPTRYINDWLVEQLTENVQGVTLGPQADGSAIIYVYPDGLKDLLLYLKDKYQNPKLFVTENGVSRSRENSESYCVGKQDEFRINFLQQHLHRVKVAIKEGVNVNGYFVWSLLDDFEFGDGYSARFGLHFIDYNNNLNRYPKDSAKWYGRFLKKD